METIVNGSKYLALGNLKNVIYWKGRVKVRGKGPERRRLKRGTELFLLMFSSPTAPTAGAASEHSQEPGTPSGSPMQEAEIQVLGPSSAARPLAASWLGSGAAKMVASKQSRV